MVVQITGVVVLPEDVALMSKHVAHTRQNKYITDSLQLVGTKKVSNVILRIHGIENFEKKNTMLTAFGVGYNTVGTTVRVLCPAAIQT